MKQDRARETAELGIVELVPNLNPTFSEPTWLGPIAEVIDRSFTEEIEAVIAAPPQHGKTELIRASMVHRLLKGGHSRNCYATYNEDKARSESRKTQMLAKSVGLSLWGNLGEWGVVGGPSLKFVGVGGSLTGHPVDGLFVFDDLVKDQADAESMTKRQAKWDWMITTAETRCHPGVSKLCVATRWHPDDPSGRLIAEGVKYINLQAIDDITGLPLWAEGRPLDFLLAKKKRLGPYRWASLYQGRPRPRGASIFGEPKYYDERPVSDYAGGIGLDLAYTKKTSADWSVMVVLRRIDFDEMIAGKKHRFSKYYVIDVVRRQVTAPEFSLLIRATSNEHPGPIVWHASGTEKGSADFIREKVKRLRVINASADKLVRSQDVAAAWNDGRVLLPNPDVFPEAKRWLEPFIAELTAFTGINDPQDDQVDALGSAFAAVKSKSRGYSSPRKKRPGALRRM